MKIKHQSGKWSKEKCFDIHIYSEDNKLIAMLPVQTAKGLPIQQANANLICAAPDMLQALQNLLKLIDRLEMSGALDNINPYSFKLDEARKAIKKATK